MEAVLTTKDLTKFYKKQPAVNGVNMHIQRGDIYGFVGENGSGKTTLIRMITGLILPTGGGFSLFGAAHDTRDICRARSRIGAIVESPSIYLNMSAYDNLKTQCILLGLDRDERIRSVLQEVGLGALYHEKKQAANFSLGMRQRLGIAMALLGEPEFLILDEPMNGLDPAGIVELRELILQLNRERGITFLISSHILTELSLVATKYGIISHGRLIREITARELHEECAKTIVLRTDAPNKLLAAVQGSVDNPVQLLPNGVQLSGEVDLNILLRAALDSGVRLLDIQCRETSFEDYYLSLIGGGKG